SYCFVAIGESFGQVYSPIYPLLLVRFLLGSGINGNLTAFVVFTIQLKDWLVNLLKSNFADG
ncbi:hypothetical protein, partial [Cylindrospermopsis raciborskii]|uniref:hypothetical protein n=1 Tax=Cylindrospermopsis raciborskii TaxID=77022 RepID=UPI001F366A21